MANNTSVPAHDRPRRGAGAAARLRHDADLRQPRLDRAAAVPRLSARLRATCSACRKRWSSAWPTATRRRRATPPSSTCIRPPASATRWATSSPRYKNRTPLVITAGQQARSILPVRPVPVLRRRRPSCPSPTSSGAASRRAPRTCRWRSPAPTTSRCSRRAARCWCRSRPTTGTAPCEPVAPSAWSARALRPDAAVLGAIGAALDASRAAGLRGRRRRRPRRRLGRGACARRARTTPASSPRRCRARCGFPEDHPLFAGFLPAMREKIVGAARRQRPHPRARRAGLHLPRRGQRAAPAGRRRAVPAHRRPDDRRLGAGRHGGGRQPPLARARPAGAPGAAAARPMPPRAAGRAPRAEPSRAACRSPTRCRRWPSCAGPSSVVVEEAPSARPVMQRHLPIAAQRDLLHDGQRRPRLRHAGGRRRRAGAARRPRRSA